MTRLLLLAGLGPALYILVLMIDSLTRPGYDPLHHFGSELANGDRGWLMIANFVLAGVLTICFAIGLRTVLRPGRTGVRRPVRPGPGGGRGVHRRPEAGLPSRHHHRVRLLQRAGHETRPTSSVA